MTHKEGHSVQECNIIDFEVDKCNWHVNIGVIVVQLLLLEKQCSAIAPIMSVGIFQAHINIIAQQWKLIISKIKNYRKV